MDPKDPIPVAFTEDETTRAGLYNTAASTSLAILFFLADRLEEQGATHVAAGAVTPTRY